MARAEPAAFHGAASRLRMLVEVVFLTGCHIHSRPTRTAATEAGRDLFAAIVVLMQWGGRCATPKDHRSSCATTPAASTPTHA